MLKDCSTLGEIVMYGNQVYEKIFNEEFTAETQRTQRKRRERLLIETYYFSSYALLEEGDVEIYQ